MKNYLSPFYTLLLVIVGLPLSAQVNCGTVDKSDPFEENILLQISENTSLTDSILPIPIQFHVTRPSDGISGFEPRFVDSILEVLNQGFINTSFEFYQCSDINYIDNDDYSQIVYQDPNLEAFFNFYNSKKAINVYLANSIFAINVSAWAYFPWSENHSYVIPYNHYNSNTHIHEMGHLLGLYHTHASGDLADGSICETKGDLCCDTPAEPQLNQNGNLDGNCVYVGTELDFNGQAYTPDIGNHMSYAPRTCRTYFTPDQNTRMEFFHNRYIRKFQCDDVFEYTDVSFDEITTIPYPAVEGEPYSLVVVTRNSGNTKTRQIITEVYHDNNQIARNNILTVNANALRGITFADRDEFPHNAGRHLICVETEGDSLEIYPCDNQLCQEILIRQEAGIPDLAIGELKKGLVWGNQNNLNPLSFPLENLGNIVAKNVLGKVYVEDVLVDSFNLSDLEVADKITVDLMIPLGNNAVNEVCIEMAPAFAEQRLDNNKSCINYFAQDSLIADIAIDSISLVPNDSLIIPGKIYQLFYRHFNYGPAAAYNNKSYLLINNSIIDSTTYTSFGWLMGQMHLDSFQFIVPMGASEVDICAKNWTLRDTLFNNNTLCLNRPVEVLSNSIDISKPSRLNVYPNPVHDIVTIETEENIKSLSIYDKLGRQLLFINEFRNNNKSINIARFQVGVYQLVIETDKTTYHKTVIKI